MKPWGSKRENNHDEDEFDEQLADLSGNVEDAQLFFKIGWQLANESTFPAWSDTSEFKAIREACLQGKSPH